MLNRKYSYVFLILLFLSIVNSRPALALATARSQAAPVSAYQELKGKFKIDMEKWLKGPAGELPDTISNLKLGLSASEYDFTDWENAPQGKGLILRQKNFTKKNLGQILENDKGKIVTVAHTFKGETGDFIRAMLRYGKERYGPFFHEYDQEKGMDNHHFKQLMSERGLSRSLVFVSGKDSLSVQVRQGVLLPRKDIGEPIQASLSKYFPDLKLEAYEENGVFNFYFKIWNESISDAYFSKLLIFTAHSAAIEKALHPSLTDWTRSKAYFLFRDKAALGWIWTEDLAAIKDIKDANAQQQFVAQKFHNTLSYFANKYGKN